MKKAILFDIDGTLLDTWHFVFDAAKYSVGLYGYSYPSNEILKKAQGKPLIEFYQILAPQADPVKLSQAHIDFQNKNLHLVKLFPEVKETLQVLKDRGFLMAAISNRKRDSLLGTLKLMGIFDYFNFIISADDVKNPKPHQEHLLTGLKQLKVEPRFSYMVGDTNNDILAGKNAKVKTIGVTYGFLGKDIAKHHPDYVIDDISQLLRILKCAKI